MTECKCNNQQQSNQNITQGIAVNQKKETISKKNYALGAARFSRN